MNFSDYTLTLRDSYAILKVRNKTKQYVCNDEDSTFAAKAIASRGQVKARSK